MRQRSDHVQVLARLKLMYQDAHRSAELRAQRADELQRQIVALRNSYRGAARGPLLATLVEQAAQARLVEQADQNTEAMAQYIAGTAGDHELIERIAARDVGGLSLLYDRYAPLIYTLALRMTASQDAAQALVEEVFVICWQAPGRFKAPTVAATLLAITRQNAPRTGGGPTSRLATEDSAQVQMQQHLPPNSVEVVHIQATLAALPDEQRRCIELAYYDCLDLTTIAKRLQLSRHAVMQSLQQGLRTLGGALPQVAKALGSSG